MTPTHEAPMSRLARIRATIQATIQAQPPALSLDAIEPYCRLICRRALVLAATESAAIAAEPALRDEQAFMASTFAKEMAALRDALDELADYVETQTDDEHQARALASDLMEAFIQGEPPTTPLSVEALRARVDAGSYLMSRWGGHHGELSAYIYYQHRWMVWMLAMGFDAPGVLKPDDPTYPEGKAEMCEHLFPVEIAALKHLIKDGLHAVVWWGASEAQNMDRGMAALNALQRQFVGDPVEPPDDEDAAEADG
jgi:hypothetical protein